MSLTLSKLRSFIAVAEESQFRRAAERLGVSQPTLSSQIRELEDFLEVSLFSRTTRNVTLTAEGERFFHRAKQMLADLESAVSEIREAGSLARGRIVIAATPTVSASLLPVAIQTFNRHFPEVSVQLHEDALGVVESKVKSGIADFGIGSAPRRESTLAFIPLFQEKFYGVVPAGHALALRRSVTLARFVAYPLIAPMPGTGIRELIDHTLRDLGLHTPTGHVLARTETVLAMIAAGLGVGLLPALALVGMDPRTLQAIQVHEPESHREIGILHRKGGSPSSAAAEFTRLCVAGDLLQPALDARLREGATAHARLFREGIRLRN